MYLPSPRAKELTGVGWAGSCMAEKETGEREVKTVSVQEGPEERLFTMTESFDSLQLDLQHGLLTQNG